MHYHIGLLHIDIHFTKWIKYSTVVSISVCMPDLVRLVVKHRSGQFVTETTFVTSETEVLREPLSICKL